MRLLQKVEGRNDLSRDPQSKAIVNVDEQSLINHRKMRERSRMTCNELKDLKSELSEMKSQLNSFAMEIKNLINLSKSLQTK